MHLCIPGKLKKKFPIILWFGKHVLLEMKMKKKS